MVLDVSEEAVRNSQKGIEQHLVSTARRLFKKDPAAQSAFVERAISHLSYSWVVSEAVRKADLIIEAIIESLEAKQALFIDVEWVSVSRLCLIFDN